MRHRHAHGGAVPKRLETDERLFLIMRPTGAGRELGGLRRLIPHAPYSVVSPPYAEALEIVRVLQNSRNTRTVPDDLCPYQSGKASGSGSPGVLRKIERGRKTAQQFQRASSRQRRRAATSLQL